jgi:hypothetical protein
MNLKRTMSEALRAGSLSEEAAAFLAAGALGAAPASSPSVGVPSTDGAHQPETLPCQLVREQSPAESPPRPLAFSPPATERSAPVSMTFRLPAGFPAALMRAAMERKLRREEPFTQQDIVAQAVREWLQRNGHPG